MLFYLKIIDLCRDFKINWHLLNLSETCDVGVQTLLNILKMFNLQLMQEESHLFKCMLYKCLCMLSCITVCYYVMKGMSEEWLSEVKFVITQENKFHLCKYIYWLHWFTFLLAVFSSFNPFFTIFCYRPLSSAEG